MLTVEVRAKKEISKKGKRKKKKKKRDERVKMM
jgi:hypothetical protein